jgi:hypothetical protein
MKIKIAMMALLASAFCTSSCSIYSLSTAEAPDGSIVTEIRNLVPPGGRDASAGSVSRTVNMDGSWSQLIDQRGAVDATGTASFLQGLVNALVTQSAQSGQSQLQLQAQQQIIQQLQGELAQMRAQLQRAAAPEPPAVNVR